MKIFRPGKPGLNDDPSLEIQEAKLAISFKANESFGGITNAVETFRNNDSSDAVDQSTAIVIGDLEEGFRHCTYVGMLRLPHCHATFVPGLSFRYEVAVLIDLAAGATAVVHSVVRTLSLPKIGACPFQKAARSRVAPEQEVLIGEYEPVRFGVRGAHNEKCNLRLLRSDLRDQVVAFAFLHISCECSHCFLAEARIVNKRDAEEGL